jgi:hypothetical protein|tara:strand:- start:309 stop:1097 length:789 start_codon:yes stop_codon:yes gene_type:complete
MSTVTSVGEIHETKDYNLFDIVKGNREVNRSHVNRLKDKIRRRDLKELPITVLSKNKSGKFPIFDGQHRYLARSELNKSIRFIVAEKLKADDISIANTDNANWVSKNFLHKFVEKGNEDYVYYESFMEEYGLNSKYSVTTTVLNNSFRRERSQEKDFEDGLFKVADKTESEETMKYINKILTEIDSSKCKNSFFYYAILFAISHVGFNRTHFTRKVEKLSAKFKGATNSQEWLDIIDKVYNKHNQGLKRFKPIVFRDFKTNK